MLTVWCKESHHRHTDTHRETHARAHTHELRNPGCVGGWNVVMALATGARGCKACLSHSLVRDSRGSYNQEIKRAGLLPLGESGDSASVGYPWLSFLFQSLHLSLGTQPAVIALSSWALLHGASPSPPNTAKCLTHEHKDTCWPSGWHLS